MQALASGWFDRRRTGTLAAREAAERMCGTETLLRSDAGVSGLGQRSIRADLGRRTFLPATNHGSNRCARIAAISAFGK